MQQTVLRASSGAVSGRPTAVPVATRASQRGRVALRPVAAAILNKPDSDEGLTYKKAGVDIDAGDELVDRIKKMNPKANIGGFGGLVPFGDSYLVAGTDGVGTKLKLAFDLNKHDTVSAISIIGERKQHSVSGRLLNFARDRPCHARRHVPRLPHTPTDRLPPFRPPLH